MKKLIYLVLLCAIPLTLFAQKEQLIKSDQIYLTFEEENLKFFEKKNFDGRENLDTELQTFFIKKNHQNIFINWLNPLKYKVKWDNSIIQDNRDVIINDFLKLLTAQFNIREEENTSNSEDVDNENMKFSSLVNTISNNDLEKIQSPELISLLLTLNEYRGKIKKTDRPILQNTFKELILIEQFYPYDLINNLEKAFTELYNITDSNLVQGEITNKRNLISNFKNQIENVDAIIHTQSLTKGTISDSEINNSLLSKHVKNSVTSYRTKKENEILDLKTLITKLEDILTLMESSINNESDSHKNFFNSNNIAFVDGKMIEASIYITKYKYNDTNKDFTEDKTVFNSKILFKKYDLISPSVGTGIFYSNTKLTGYGISTNDSDELIVAEDTIESNQAITALFLNLNFDINSRYLSPLLQLGIDPTKKRPFLLFGIGLSIPSSRFSISGGPIWTWSPSLNDLNVGDKIDSSIILENDIEYKFNAKPKGWYLGLQYSL